MSIDLVSVIMPSYNSSEFISNSINSVLGQSYTNFELIIVDDSSSDTTQNIIKKYALIDSRIKYHFLNKNSGGPAHPRNEGLRLAHGKWIAYIDSDDIWHPEKLKLQLYYMQLTGAKLCSSRIFVFEKEYKNNIFNANSNLNCQFKKVSFLSQLIKFKTPISSVVIDKDTFNLIRFNDKNKFNDREDIDYFLHCHELIEYSIKLLCPLVMYRKSPNQRSSNKIKMINSHFHVLRNYKFKNGFKLGFISIIFLLSHNLIAFYNHLLKKGV